MIITPGVDFTDVAAGPPIGDMSWSGYQKKKLFRNLGDSTFKEMAAAGRRGQRPRRPRHRAWPTSTATAASTSIQTNAEQAALLYRNATDGRRPLARA